jgi:hypothetical protein
MRQADEPGAVRWEALSHAQIHHGVHTPEVGTAPSLAATVPVWRESVADLGEIRSRYEAAVSRLLTANAGANADAATVASRLVTRGLTDAGELTALAGARRARLLQRNGELRRSMPDPTAPVEHGSGFVLGGQGWLEPPDFERAEAARINAGDVARDKMREYELDLANDTLAHDASRWRELPGAHAVDPFDGPTVQLSGTRASAAPTVDASRTDPRPAHHADERTEPSFGMGGRSRGANRRDREFGPRGHAHLHDHRRAEDEPPPVRGTPPPPRDYVEERPRSRSDNLFESDDRASPPVIGL